MDPLRIDIFIFILYYCMCPQWARCVWYAVHTVPKIFWRYCVSTLITMNILSYHMCVWRACVSASLLLLLLLLRLYFNKLWLSMGSFLSLEQRLCFGMLSESFEQRERKKTKSHRLFPKRTHHPNEQSFNIALRMNQQIGFDCVDKITSKRNKNRLSSPCTYLSYNRWTFFHNRHKSISEHCLSGLAFSQMTNQSISHEIHSNSKFNIDYAHRLCQKNFAFNFDLTLKENPTVCNWRRMLWLRFKWIFHNGIIIVFWIEENHSTENIGFSNRNLCWKPASKGISIEINLHLEKEISKQTSFGFMCIVLMKICLHFGKCMAYFSTHPFVKLSTFSCLNVFHCIRKHCCLAFSVCLLVSDVQRTCRFTFNCPEFSQKLPVCTSNAFKQYLKCNLILFTYWKRE